MAKVNRTISTESEIRRSVADVRLALSQHAKGPNIYAFYSNKNKKLLTIVGDVTFITCVLLEGTAVVQSYQLDSPTVIGSIDGEVVSAVVDISVVLTDGTVLLIECGRAVDMKAPTKGRKRRQLSAELQAARASGSRFIAITEDALNGSMTLFHNWLLLSGHMTRVLGFTCEDELKVLVGFLTQQQSATIRAVTDTPGVDAAKMYAVIARCLAAGTIECDLDQQLLHPGALVSLRKGSSPNAIPRFLRGDAGHPPAVAARIGGRRLANISAQLRDVESWAKLQVTDRRADADYRSKELAVRLFYQDVKLPSITEKTGLSESWIRKLARKCLALDRHGRHLGFLALIRGTRTTLYTRVAPIRTDESRATRGGFAGAFRRLLALKTSNADYPTVLDFLEAVVLQTRKELSTGVRRPWSEILELLKAFLTESCAVAKDSYPFRPPRAAYESLRQFCHGLLYKKPMRWLEIYAGADAVHRRRMRSDESALIEAVWTGEIIQADFVSKSLIATVYVPDPFGALLPIPLARWSYGHAVDVYLKVVIGSALSLHHQATSDCTIDLLDSCICPPDEDQVLNSLSAPGVGGNWLPNQLFPQTAFQGCDILSLDRAWANKSTSLITAAVFTLGCAVRFGAAYAWQARDDVEEVHRKLMALVDRQTPSTLGTGPADPLRPKNPTGVALERGITLLDAEALHRDGIRRINATRTAGLHYQAPIERLKACTSGNSGPYFPRPLPLEARTERLTQWITFTPRVEGRTRSGKTGTILVRQNDIRFYGRDLSRAHHLVNQRVKLEVGRRDIRQARVTEASGMPLGDVRPAAKWRRAAVSWRDAILIQRAGPPLRVAERPAGVGPEFMRRLAERAVQSAKRGRPKTSKEARTHERMSRSAKRTSDGSAPANDGRRRVASSKATTTVTALRLPRRLRPQIGAVVGHSTRRKRKG